MEVTVGIHIVKPSSPTPLESKTHKLSSLDQVAPPIYSPLLFFYHNNQSTHHSEISRHLRQSLSEILTIFYPVAGTRHNSFIDCNDRGAVFVEARVHAPLTQLLQPPSMEELNQFLPVDSSSYDDSATLLLVKLSHFDCGGISLGICLSHVIGDATSFAMFIYAWAATCRRLICGGGGGGTPQSIHPSFDLAHHFPPIDPWPTSGFIPGFTKQKITLKRLVFEQEKLEKLRKIDPRPSRVEAVSAFIWRSFIQAYKATPSPPPSYSATHTVSLRLRTNPPLPDQITGNCFTFVSAIVSGEEDHSDDVLVSRLRAAIREVDDAYINGVVKDESHFRAIEDAGDSFKPENLLFTSWVRYPVYDVDFGWGKPVLVCPTTVPFMKAVILMSTADGDGVEAWINIVNNDDGFFQTLQANYDKLFASST